MDDFDVQDVFWVPTGTRVQVDPAHAVAGDRHPDHVHAYHKPYVGQVIGFNHGLYQIVDDDGTMRPAEPDWLSIVD